MKPALLVLAAGIGSRYGGLKQLDPVGPSGEIILDYSVFDAMRAGFGKVVFVIRREIEDAFRNKIGNRFEKVIDCEYAFQELNDLPEGFTVPADRKKPWGTGHAILVANNAINEPFAVINADDFYGKSAYELLANRLLSAKDKDTADYCMCGFVLNNTLSDYGHVARGICESDNNDMLANVRELTKIEKKNGAAINTAPNGVTENLTGNELVSMNMWGFTPSIFNHIRDQFTDFLKQQGSESKSEFFIPSVVADLITAKKANVSILRSTDQWFGVTYQEDKPNVVESIANLVKKGIYPEKLFA